MINNRQQSGRRRGRGGQRQGGGQGNPGGGNRIDNRARGNANQLWEKYKSLAADAQRQGDRVQTEYYLQFADHYYRVLAETRPNFHEQQREQRAREDRFDDDQEADGADYGEEGEAIRPGEQAMQQRGNSGERGGERGSDRDRGDRRFDERRPRRDDEDRPRRAEGDSRPQRADDDRPRRGDVGYDGERRPRRDRDDRFNGQPRAEAPEPIEADRPVNPLGASEVEPDLPLSEPVAESGEVAQPRRRGRPRKVVAEEPMGFDADRLPPALGAPANDADEPAEAKPRRRRTRTAPTEVSAAE